MVRPVTGGPMPRLLHTTEAPALTPRPFQAVPWPLDPPAWPQFNWHRSGPRKAARCWLVETR